MRRRKIDILLFSLVGIAGFACLIFFLVIPVWSECLSKNSFLLCAAVLGGK